MKQLGLKPHDRIRHAFFNEGLALMGEGIPAARIEDAAIDAGFKDGPLALLDEEGLQIIDRLYHQALDAQGHGGCCGHHHEHEHGCGHGHSGHGHGCGHEHGHAEHGHTHGHSCGHGHAGHEHKHDSGHGQDTAHGACCGHGHAEHGHKHAHHDHEPAGHTAAATDWPQLTEEGAYVMEKMAHGLQRFGRADGGGFYDYEEDEDGDEERVLWDGLKAFVRRGVELSENELQDRLRFAPVVEWLKDLAASTASIPQPGSAAPATGTAPATANVGSAGDAIRSAAHDLAIRSRLWPAGQSPLSLIEALGAEGFEQRAAALAARYGERFALPAQWCALLAG